MNLKGSWGMGKVGGAHRGGAGEREGENVIILYFN